jgi:putative phosphoribosyl transferase
MPKTEHSLKIPVTGVELQADVAVPDQARGVVVFAHGSGSSRHSPRNQYVAGELNAAGFGTVLADLLTAEEERADDRTGEYRFDIERLAVRTTALTDWAGEHELTAGLPIGLFGASTGAAAALIAAAARPESVATVVSRGGRPDLAGEWRHLVRQPVLLVVGELDGEVRKLNEQAQAAIGGNARLVVVPDATHLFEESGTLEQVAEYAEAWFTEHLTGPASSLAPD